MSELLTLRDVALKLRLSERSIWTATKKLGLPVVRIGHSVRVDPTALAGWLASRTTTTTATTSEGQ